LNIPLSRHVESDSVFVGREQLVVLLAIHGSGSLIVRPIAKGCQNKLAVGVLVVVCVAVALLPRGHW
jgi:hypothetical protein